MMQSFVHSIWWIKEPLLGKWPARLNGSNRSGGLFCGFLFVKIWYDLTYEYRNDKTFKSNAPRGGSGGYSQKGIHFACRTCRGGGEWKRCSSVVTRSKDSQTGRKIAGAPVPALVMIIYYHPHFRRNYRGLDKQVKAQAEESVTLFRRGPFHVRLDTHRLHGKLKKQWSFSVNSRDRILF